MTIAAANPDNDPTLAVAERQLVLLGELTEIAMAAARAFGVSAVAAAEAEKQILSEEWFTPEVGRARACGAKDAADSLQKATRAVRLTMKLEMAVAEIVRDIRAGIVTHSHAGGDAGAPAETPRSGGRSAGVLAGSSSSGETRDRDPRDADTEHLVEFDRPDRLPRGVFGDVVDGLRADIGAASDGHDWSVGQLKLEHRPIKRRPPDWETRPPGSYPPQDLPGKTDRPAHPPP